MTTPPDDPLATSEAVDRAYYAVGVMLDAERLGDEQTYHRGRLARALAYLHGVGTVAGLFVRYDPAIAPGPDPKTQPGRDEQIVVQPGIAIDPFGRLIEVPVEACLRVPQWFQGEAAGDLDLAVHGAPYNGVVADLFLRFLTYDRGMTPAFATGPFEALDAVVPSRLRDGYELSLVLRQEATPPTPAIQWPTLAMTDAVADRPKKLHQAIFNAWRGDRATLTAALKADPLLPANLDPASVLLARVVILATRSVPPGGRPTRNTAATPSVTIDNEIRPFVVSAQAIARWLGI
jgi:hypothetical protein